MRRLALLAPIAALIAVCAGAPAARQAPSRIADTFDAYADDAAVTAAWDADVGGWEVRGGRFVSDGMGHSFAMPVRAPHAEEVTVDTVVTISGSSGSAWKTAGVAIVRDDDNYWHLAVVEGPDADGKRHYVELAEKLAGRWPAQGEEGSRLEATATQGGDFAWQYDRPYRLRLAMGPAGIEGTLAEIDGTVRVRLGYAFGAARAVRVGRSALVTSSLSAAFDDFAATTARPVDPPAGRVFPRYVRLATTPPPARGKRTGYFHVEKLGGRWWIIDPSGAAFYGVGTDHVNFNAHWCEKLGYAPYSRNVAARHGTEEAWARSSVARLKAWGFNSLGAGHSPSTRYRGLAHTEFLSFGVGFVGVSDIAPRTTWTGFPDVFHPRFASYCERQARRACAPLRNDPWLIGYFIDNELEWFGKNGSDTGLVDEAMKKPADHPANRALVSLLKSRYPQPEKLEEAWGVRIGSFDALASRPEPIVTRTARGAKDRLDFVRLIAERYFAITTAAIRKADPNHMVLGCRFAGIAPPVWDIAGKHLDIVTVNYYGQVDLARGVSTDMPAAMARYHGLARRPLMITEWSFPALDAGLPSQHGAGQRVPTQADKARCYAIYQRALFGMPFMVGSNYFMWVDEPALGISSTFPEDSNYGLVDVNDRPWQTLVRTATRINAMADRLHAADTPELRAEVLDPPGGPPMVRVRNLGRRRADCSVHVWVQGRARVVHASIEPGKALAHPVTVRGPALVVVEADPEERLVECSRADNRAEQVVGARGAARRAVVVVNPTGTPIQNVPITIALPPGGPSLTVRAPAGVSAVVQRDALPGGPKLAVRLARVPARTAVTLRLVPGRAPSSKAAAGGDRAIDLPGPLRLQRDAGSGNVFDRVGLNGTHLGRLAVLMHQVTGQPLWVHPDRVERIDTWEGPARTVVRMTVALGDAGRAAAITAVDPAGGYTAQAQRPNRYRATFDLTRWAGESWFSVRFVSLENTDTRPWRCASYFIYPLSAIGGRTEDDRSLGAGSAPLWHDAAAGLTYGALVDTSRMTAAFFKDDPEGAAEHPDIYRKLDLDLAPGQTVRAAPDEAEVWLYGARGAGSTPGGAVLERLRALRCVSVQPVR